MASWLKESQRWLDKANQKVSEWSAETELPQDWQQWSQQWQKRLRGLGDELQELVQQGTPEILQKATQLRDELDALSGWYDTGSRYFDAGQTLLQLAVRTYVFRKLKKPNLDADAATQKEAELHQRNASELADLCRRQGGAWVKAAQFLSCQGDWLPSAYAEQLAELQDQAPPCEWERIEEQLALSYGPDWALRFEHIDPTPVATASIAQVHRGRTRSGTDIALKVQLPEAAERIDADLLFFQRIAPLLQHWAEGLDVEQTVRELSLSIRRELDYFQEAEHLTKFSARYQAEEWTFPALLPDLLQERTLGMVFVEGQPLRQFLADVPQAAEPVLQTLVRSFVKQIFVSGLFHADPHPGNFFVTPKGKLALLDFGAVGQLSEKECAAYQKILVALFSKEAQGFDELLREAGFTVPDGPLLLRLLFERDPKEFEGLSQMETHIRIMRRAEVQIPDNFVLMGRVLISIGGLLQQYKVRVNLQELALYLMMEASRKP